MTIGEAMTGGLAIELAAKMRDHIPVGALSHSILMEYGGSMVVLITEWADKGQCFSYHLSHSYTRFITDTQHMLVGNYVVKLLFTSEAK